MEDRKTRKGLQKAKITHTKYRSFQKESKKTYNERKKKTAKIIWIYMYQIYLCELLKKKKKYKNMKRKKKTKRKTTMVAIRGRWQSFTLYIQIYDIIMLPSH